MRDTLTAIRKGQGEINSQFKYSKQAEMRQVNPEFGTLKQQVFNSQPQKKPPTVLQPEFGLKSNASLQHAIATYNSKVIKPSPGFLGVQYLVSQRTTLPRSQTCLANRLILF